MLVRSTHFTTTLVVPKYTKMPIISTDVVTIGPVATAVNLESIKDQWGYGPNQRRTGHARKMLTATVMARDIT